MTPKYQIYMVGVTWKNVVPGGSILPPGTKILSVLQSELPFGRKMEKTELLPKCAGGQNALMTFYRLLGLHWNDNDSNDTSAANSSVIKVARSGNFCQQKLPDFEFQSFHNLSGWDPPHLPLFIAFLGHYIFLSSSFCKFFRGLFKNKKNIFLMPKL